MMNYSKEFNDLVKKSIENDQYVGLGNPNAKILFVGKEPRNSINSKLDHGSGQSWVQHNDYSKPYELDSNNLTWQKYQKLYDIICPKQNEKSETPLRKKIKITFVKNVFTTELSILSAPNTKEAKKHKNFVSKLKERKEVFWESDFIKQFPIVVIFASDNKYIETYQGEVCELFKVEFHELITLNKSNKLWIHYASESEKIYPKLLIHTRQLTNGASQILIDKIAEEINKFAIKNNIQICSK